MACRVLGRLGISLARVRSEVERQVAHGEGRLGQDMQLTPRAKRVIDIAYDEARQLNNNYIGTEHLLLGLIREAEGLAGKVLVMLGADLGPRHVSEVKVLQEGKAAERAAEKAGDGLSLDAVPHTALDDFKKAMMAFVASYRPPERGRPAVLGNQARRRNSRQPPRSARLSAWPRRGAARPSRACWKSRACAAETSLASRG